MIGKIRKDDGENAQSNIVTAIGKNIVGAVVAGIFTVICVILTTQGNIKVEQMKQIYGGRFPWQTRTKKNSFSGRK